jgi:hypothetical protein
MPHLFLEKVAVTLDELVPSHYSSYDALKKALQRSEQRGYGIKRITNGGHGRQLLVDYDTLPREMRESMKDPRVMEHPLEHFYSVDSRAVEFYTEYRYNNGLYLSDELQEKYITNASVLQASYLLRDAREQERLSKMGKLGDIMRTIADDVRSFNDLLKRKYDTQHTLPGMKGDARRFYEIYHKFRKESYVALISQKVGNQNRSLKTDNVTALLNSIFSEPAYKPTYAEVVRQYESFLSGYVEVINNETGEIYEPKMFRSLSKSTIYNYLSAWDSRIATHAIRSGNRQVYMGNYKPHHSLEQPTLAGSIISVDDRQPPFEYAKGQRMWFYNAIDLASEAFVCWVYGRSKEGIILEFYRQLVRNFHEWGLPLPAEIEAESSLNSSYKNTFLSEGSMFEYVRIEANNARGKRIEAYYKQLRYGYEKKHEGWLARPMAISESNQSGPVDKIQIPYDQLIDQCLGDIEAWNNTPHSKQPELTRWEYFLNNQNPNNKPTNYKTFIKTLGIKTETSCNAGIVRLQNSEFLLADNGEIALGEKLVDIMTLAEGRALDVYWLDDNDGNVFVAYAYLKDGDRMICQLMPKPRYNRARAEQTPEDSARREVMSSYVATIEAFGRRQRHAIERVTIINGTEQRPEPKVKFSIRGPRKPVVETDQDNEVEFEGETINGVRVMPQIEEIDELNEVERPYKSDIRDRF